MVLTDFGIARIQGEDPLTVSGEFVGSLEFIAPERMSGKEASPASDLWSLGVLLYAAVEGWSPFRRTTLESTLAAILQGEPPKPVQAGPLAELIVRLLSKDPSQRPAVAEVERDLAAVADGGPPSATVRLRRAVSPTRPFPNWGSAPDSAPQSPAGLGFAAGRQTQARWGSPRTKSGGD